jgi:hypothetical protein
MEGSTPENILVVVVCLMLLGVGIFVMTIFVTSTDMETNREETYAVSDPTIDFSVDLTYVPATKPTVMQYNGIEWLPVDSADVEWSGLHNIIIKKEGMQG